MSPPLTVDFVYDCETDARDALTAIVRRFETDDTAKIVSRRDSDNKPTPSRMSVSIPCGDTGTTWSFIPYPSDIRARPSTVGEYPCIEVEMSGSAFDLWDESARQTVVDTISELYQAGPVRPRYVYAVDEGHAEIIREDGPASVPVASETFENDCIAAVSWLMLFPPTLVAAYGRDFLLDAPAWRTEELPDGAILIVACSDPTDVADLDESSRDLKAYFGTEYPRL